MVGIYKISSKIKDRVYVGSSRNILKRWGFHIKELKKKKHHNYKLQEDYNECSIEGFTFEVLALYSHNLTTHELKQFEQEWMDKYPDKYNIYDTVDPPKEISKIHQARKRKKEKKKKKRKGLRYGLSARDKALQKRYDAIRD